VFCCPLTASKASSLIDVFGSRWGQVSDVVAGVIGLV